MESAGPAGNRATDNYKAGNVLRYVYMIRIGIFPVKMNLSAA